MTSVGPFDRVQKDFKLIDYAPNIGNLCACGCGVELKGRQTRWASPDCASNAYAAFSIIKGNTGAIRSALYEIDKGHCRNCGAYDDNWEADHIVPVFKGGGGCDLSNLQTLCKDCHKEKTKQDVCNR